MPGNNHGEGAFNGAPGFEFEVVTAQDEFINLGFDHLYVQHFRPELESLARIGQAMAEPERNGPGVQEHLVRYDAERRESLNSYFQNILQGEEFDLAISHQNREHMLGAVLMHHVDDADTTLNGIFDIDQYSPELAEASFDYAKGFVASLGRSVVAIEDNNKLMQEQGPGVIVRVNRGGL